VTGREELQAQTVLFFRRLDGRLRSHYYYFSDQPIFGSSIESNPWHGDCGVAPHGGGMAFCVPLTKKLHHHSKSAQSTGMVF